jgi:hypothetical protein
MKTQVMHLDAHDDLISIRDRMAWAKTPRILLVWPKRGSVDVRPLDLSLLHRHAQSLGAELGLVTRNRDIRAAARELRISIFSTTSEAQKRQWLERRPAHPVRRFPRTNLRAIRQDLPTPELFTFAADPVRRVIVFAVGVLSVLVVMLVFIPSAEIRMTLPEQVQALTISVSSEPEIQKVQLSGVVPQHKLTLTIDGKDTILASGSTTLPVKQAEGQALLMNLTDTAVSVPSGTVLLTHSDPPVSFLTGEKIDVPAGKGKTVNVAIRAARSGSQGNVEPGMVTLFEGPLGLKLAVTNPEPTKGGTQSKVALAVQKDRDSLRKRLLADLERQALQRFTDQVSPGDVLFPATITQTRLMGETFDPPDGQAGEKLTLNLQVEYGISYASSSDLRSLAESVLNASLPPRYSATSGLTALKSVSAFSTAQGVVRWQMYAERRMRSSLNTEQVIALVEGKTQRNAGLILTDKYNLAQNPQINVRPGWWPWLPFLPMRITVKG